MFEFRAKSGREQRVRLSDPRLATVVLGPPRSATDARRKIVAAIDAAAARLNNTREVCRRSYVNSRAPQSYLDGALHQAFTRAEARDRLRDSEAAVLLIVAGTGDARPT